MELRSTSSRRRPSGQSASNYHWHQAGIKHLPLLSARFLLSRKAVSSRIWGFPCNTLAGVIMSWITHGPELINAPLAGPTS